MIRAAARRARAWADELTGPAGPPTHRPQPPPATAARVEYRRLTRVTLTDEVSRALFDEYAAHRQTDRGAEETGWVLLGVREAEAATVLATLPAGANRDAGEEHVRFNVEAQTLANRIVRQGDRRLTVLGVVHTHPGTLRHPSGGDLRGDREWVKQLRGAEGVFGIGTADDTECGPTATHPAPNVQCYGRLRFDWYTLADGDGSYRPVPIELTIGPDVAKPLRPVWAAVEAHAARLDALARQLAKVRFGITDTPDGPALAVEVELAEPGHRIRVLMVGEKAVKFYYEAGGEVYQPDLPAGTDPDYGVYQMLAELAART